MKFIKLIMILTTALLSIKYVLANDNLIPVWKLDPEDKTIRSGMTKWCQKAGWQLVWNVKADYPIDTSWTINAGFESAVNEVLKATQHSEMPLMATMHDSNKVLEIYSPVTSK